eukprot:CAMPEP_0196699116 /NCGR_PEP_ID=MMETSP1090-20130531/46236_1 /TAXON_ID=37098 /ORGANISM="Isochrysis sp, Strain CCMP1244" /LENGTH=32 /DNA_ID= /DNA_START= /DNA_END= /DNA_ORIENTATION=
MPPHAAAMPIAMQVAQERTGAARKRPAHMGRP